MEEFKFKNWWDVVRLIRHSYGSFRGTILFLFIIGALRARCKQLKSIDTRHLPHYTYCLSFYPIANHLINMFGNIGEYILFSDDYYHLKADKDNLVYIE